MSKVYYYVSDYNTVNGYGEATIKYIDENLEACIEYAKVSAARCINKGIGVHFSVNSHSSVYNDAIGKVGENITVNRDTLIEIFHLHCDGPYKEEHYEQIVVPGEPHPVHRERDISWANVPYKGGDYE